MHWPKRFKQRNIYQCAALFTCLQFLMACNGFWYRRGRFIVNRWTKLYTAIMPIIILALLLFCLQQLLKCLENNACILTRDKLELFICSLELLMSSCALLLTAFTMLHNVREHVKLYDRLHLLDKQLLRDFGVNLNYHKLFLRNLIEVFPLFVIHSLAAFWTVWLVQVNRVLYAYAAAIFYLGCVSGSELVSFTHSNFAQILRIRFCLIQTLLNPIYLKKIFPQQELCERRILILLDMVRSLHEIIESINAVYGISIAAALAHDFTLITTQFYMVFGHSMEAAVDFEFYAYSALWILTPLYRIFKAPYNCHRAVEEGKRCLRLIKHIDIWFPNFKSAKAIVASTMQWRLENNIVFTSGFNLIYNKAIILTITAVIFNYLLILIQFRLTQLMGEKFEEEKVFIRTWIGNL